MIDKKLKSQHEALAALLARGTSTSAAAQELEIGQATAYRWSRRADVMARVRELQAETTGAAVASLKGKIRSAIDTLSSLAEDEQIPPSVRCSAAGRLLDSGLKSLEVAEILERLQNLENRLQHPYKNPFDDIDI